jgi:hypothetical protein
MSDYEGLPGTKVAGVLGATLVIAALLVGLAALITRPTLKSGRGLTPLVPLFASPPKTIDGFSWVDRDRGIVRIPVEDAIDLLSEGRP